MIKTQKNIVKNKLKNKKGSEIVENVLMMAVILAIIIIVFYPQLKILLSTIITNINTEFVMIIEEIFAR